MIVRICPECGYNNPERSWYCGKCGETLSIDTIKEVNDSEAQSVLKKSPEIITCPKCNYQCPEGASFCPNCGKKIEGEDKSKSEPQFSSTEKKRCPYCAEEIQKDAIVCRYCGRDLMESKPEIVKPNRKHPSFCSGCLIVLSIGLLIMCFLLVPTREDHNVGICSHIITELGKEILINTQIQTDLREQLLSGLVIRQLCRQYFPFSLPGVKYDNYLVFSTSTINNKLISFGILKNVFIITPIQVWGPDLQEASIRAVENLLNILGSGIPPGVVVPTLFP